MSSVPSTASPCFIYPHGKMVQLNFDLAVLVAPGQMVMPRPATVPLPRIGWVEWEPAGAGHEGLYRPMLRLTEPMIPRQQWDEKRFGIGIKGVTQLYVAGFVEATLPTPQRFLINLRSFYEHMAACQADPEFWTPERSALFHAARLSLRGSRGVLRRLPADIASRVAEVVQNHYARKTPPARSDPRSAVTTPLFPTEG